ncbi:hypothetical protein VTK56DRAFT_5909 [Thermocarpiscus australiensis]
MRVFSFHVKYSQTWSWRVQILLCPGLDLDSARILVGLRTHYHYSETVYAYYMGLSCQANAQSPLICSSCRAPQKQVAVAPSSLNYPSVAHPATGK